MSISSLNPLKKPILQLSADEYHHTDWDAVAAENRKLFLDRYRENDIPMDEAEEKWLEARKRTSEILFYLWDPYRLAWGSIARYAYERHVAAVMRLALEHEEPEPIAELLGWLSERFMGRDAEQEKNQALAETLHAIVQGYLHFPDGVVVEID